MPADGSRPRQAAARALRLVLDDGRALDEALQPLLEPLGQARDRSLTRRLCHGVLRDWPALDWLVRQRVARPLKGRNRTLHFLLAAAIHELRDGREPAPAVVHASVAAARSLGGQRLGGLVNAVLRNFGRQQEALLASLPDTPAVRHGYPGWLIERIQQDHGARADAVLAAGNAVPPLWLRVNRRRSSVPEYRRLLADAGIEAQAVAGFDDALVLSQRVAVRQLPGFDDGLVSIQDGAAQLAADRLELADGLRVLDACAAPGGKSAHILERARVDLTCLDIDTQRLQKVGRGLERLGLAAQCLAGDATQPQGWWDGQPFDRILVDAPCSATGVIRRHPDIRWLRRPGDIASLAATQQALLDALWPLVRPGGILVYATCSLIGAENHHQAHAFLNRHADAQEVKIAGPAGFETAPGWQILPGDRDCDGFYYCAARRLP